MKKKGRLLLYVVLGLIAAMVVLVSYISLALPDVGKPENIKIVLTPERIARGAYLANHVCLCMDCHSQRDWSKPVGPIAVGKLGAGGDEFGPWVGVPGSVYVPNITPYNLRNWTDGEILRAITTGERNDGSAIYPIMPWRQFAAMNREDLYAIIAYLRSIKPIVTKPYPAPKLDFPYNILEHTMPRAAKPAKAPPVSDTAKYGAYLVSIADCGLCHSPKKDGRDIPGMEYSGGIKFDLGTVTEVSANLTPDKTTGIGNWTSDVFLSLFKSHREPANIGVSAMPWYDYSGMNDTDLKAIFVYLKTLKPVHNKLVRN